MPSEIENPNDSPRVRANRRNALRSTGPRTAEGKAKSSRNALRHGLYANDLIVIGEEEGVYLDLLDEFNAEFQPQTPAECDLVASMAHARWRILRTEGIETAVYDEAISDAKRYDRGKERNDREWIGEAFDSLTGGTVLTALDRAESRYYRHFDRALRQLITLRKLRQKSPQGPLPANVIEFPAPKPEAA